MRSPMLMILSLLLVASCGGADSSETEVYTDADGNEARVTRTGDDDGTSIEIETKDGQATISTGATLASPLPFGLKPYPGAQIATSTIGNSGGQSGAMLLMQSEDSIDSVIAHYRKQAEAAGFAIEAEMKSGTTKMLTGQREQGGVFSVQAQPVDSGTQITLIVGER